MLYIIFKVFIIYIVVVLTIALLLVYGIDFFTFLNMEGQLCGNTASLGKTKHLIGKSSIGSNMPLTPNTRMEFYHISYGNT